MIAVLLLQYLFRVALRQAHFHYFNSLFLNQIVKRKLTLKEQVLAWIDRQTTI